VGIFLFQCRIHLTSVCRSVHNTRIERLWVEFTQGVGAKWKLFFLELEEFYGLDPDLPAHIWLLHWLFLDEINHDVEEWTAAWNSHKMSLPDDQERSPRDMFIFGMLEHGPRGLQEMLTQEQLPDEYYGVDWEALNDLDLMRHFHENNPDDQGDPYETQDNPFRADGLPTNLSVVECEVEPCGLAVGFTETLIARLQTVGGVEFESRDMASRCLVWQRALEVCLDVAHQFIDDV
jgi:hypothetical protein